MSISSDLRDEINAFIEYQNKTDEDWKTFLQLKKEIESQSKLEYFPLFVLNENTNRYVKLNKKRFLQITGSECECG